MDRRLARIAALGGALLLGSCQPYSPGFEIAVGAQGEIRFNTHVIRRWLFIPAREAACFERLKIYDADGFTWQIAGPTCQSTAFPVTYGTPPRDAATIDPPRPLVPGRRYGVVICGGDFLRDAWQEFTMPPPRRPGILSPDAIATLQSPDDRDDTRRAAAIARGETVPTIDACTREGVG